MAVKLILAVGLVLLIGGTVVAQYPDVPQQGQDSIADEVKEVKYLVETLKDLIDEEDMDMTEEFENEPSVDDLEEGLEDYEDEEGIQDIDGLNEEEDVAEEFEEDFSLYELPEETVQELRQQPPPAIRRVSRTCANRDMTISCPYGQRINIRAAMWGRISPVFCTTGGPIQTTLCGTSLLTKARVSSRCQGKTSCSISASNGVFGDPCPGTYKYLEVRYTCTGPRPTCPTGKWTGWYHKDNPEGTGDLEDLVGLRRRNPGICARPRLVLARVKGSNEPAYTTRQFIYKFSPTEGFICRHADQPSPFRCKDYEVRFCCP